MLSQSTLHAAFSSILHPHHPCCHPDPPAPPQQHPLHAPQHPLYHFPTSGSCKTQYTLILVRYLIRLSQNVKRNLVKSIFSILNLISRQLTEMMGCPWPSDAQCFAEHHHMKHDIVICLVCSSSQKGTGVSNFCQYWACMPQVLPKRCLIAR